MDYEVEYFKSSPMKRDLKYESKPIKKYQNQNMSMQQMIEQKVKASLGISKQAVKEENNKY